jgi:release factor glutamine methyltransferase
MSTVLETIDGGTRYLEKRGIADARRNMQLLVAHQLNCTRMDLYLQFDRPLDDSDLAPLREALRKRGEGIPLQHLLGTVEFHRREFATDARALIPRPETEELVERVLALPLPPKPAILDMGTGSGVLGLTIAAETSGHATLADVSPDALALAADNAQRLGLTNVTLVCSDLFASLTGQYDLIVANLPYIAEGERARLAVEVRHDPDLALFSGPDGLDLIRRFIPDAYARLNPGGWLAMEIGHDQATAVAALLADVGFVGVEVFSDLSKIARFPIARKP